MLDFTNAAQALQELQKQGVVWLVLLDVVPEKSGKDQQPKSILITN